MPLIVFCGTPLSGKSLRVNDLHAKLLNSSLFTSSSLKSVVIISDEEKLLEQGPDEIYKNSQKEKELRSWLKSEVQRYLASQDTIVILDSANYIKGYRYELYCLSKQFKTTHVLIECLQCSNIEEQFARNHQIDPKRSYSKEIFDELIQRYETPSSSNRWEEPLFRIDSSAKDLPFDDIGDAIFKRSALKPNKSTQNPPSTTDNFLFELDSQTQDVIKQIQSALQLNQLRDIKIQRCSVPVNLNRKIPIVELNKYRRQFINYARLNPINEKERIITAFVQFINNGSNFE